MHLIRFALYLATLGLISLFFPAAAAGALFAKGGGGGGFGKVASILDPIGSALGIHDVILGGEEAAPEVADPTAPPATSGPTADAAAAAAGTEAAEEADRLARAADEEEVKRRRLTGQTSLTGPLGISSTDTFLTRRSLLG